MLFTEIIKNEFRSRVSTISLLVSVLALAVMILTLNETNLPLLSDFGSAFLVLWIIGFSMSVFAGARDNTDGEFTLPKQIWVPLSILGVLSGVLLIMAILDVGFLIIDTQADRFVLLSVFIILKWLLVHIYNITLVYKTEELVD